ncbi:MAG: Mov34/MPN/PAD-1 family protein [Oceanicaulis sp.]|nr:Mov34/MPN/PAD-1 family protein [Oceanicaulis sp.]
MSCKEIGGWTIRAHSSTIDQMRSLRTNASPIETGGLLLGIVDHARKRIEVVVGLPAPADSVGTANSFERGIKHLRSALEATSATVMHQIMYIGEWHSHPKGARAVPSLIDRRQLNALAAETAPDERPAVMIIIANDDFGIFSLDCV